MLFGQRIILAEAEQEFKAFVEQGNLPAAWTILGLSAMDTSHPQRWYLECTVIMGQIY